MVNYICPIFWFATQTFNRGEKKGIQITRWTLHRWDLNTWQTHNERLVKKINVTNQVQQVYLYHGFACLSDQVTVGNKKDVVDRMISLVRMFRDRSRISTVANSFYTKYSVASEWMDVTTIWGMDGKLWTSQNSKKVAYFHLLGHKDLC